MSDLLERDAMMPIKGVIFDAYGTLLRNEDLRLIPQRLVADHGLSIDVDDLWRTWADLYHEATQSTPFRSLRAIEEDILARIARTAGLEADMTPYVDLFFQVTTKVELYPEVLPVLAALAPARCGIVSNADHEHVSAWPGALPVEFILISEALRAYKPDPCVFEAALERLGLAPHEVLHVGDSDVDDVQGARAAGLRVAWINRDGRPRRAGVPAPDYELRDLTVLPALFREISGQR
jgi:2-haloalkanoic acid dehalogenase type II